MTHTLLSSLALAVLIPLPVSAQRFLGKSETDWLRDLDHKESKQRRSAAHALGRIGNGDGEVLARLTRALGDRDPSVRDAAAFALGEIALRGSNDRRVREQAETELLARLRDDDPRVRRSAAYALGSCGSTRSAEDALLRALNDPEPTVRQGAAWALGRAGDRASPAVVRSVQDAVRRERDPLALRDAVAALGAVGKTSPGPAAEELARALQSSRDNVIRKTALQGLLGLMGPDMAKAAPDTHRDLVRALRDVLRTADPESKGLVAGALDHLGIHAAPALPELADLIDDDRASPEARRNATVTVTKLWPYIKDLPPAEARDVIARLSRALGPKHPNEVRSFVAETLARIGYPLIDPATAALLDALEGDKDTIIRQRCAWCFLNCDNLASRKEAVRVLRKALKDSHRPVSYDSARALARGLLDQAGTDVIDVLDQMLHDRTLLEYDRTTADVSGGGESSGGTSSVKQRLGGDARYMAAQALGLIGSSAARPHIVRTLQEMSTSTDPKSSQHAKQALQRMGK